MKKTIFTLLFTIISITIFGQNIVKEIPFRLTKYNNILVPVIINQKDTVQLMLHTGSDYITIIEDSYKKMKSISISDTLNNVTSWAGYSDMKMSKNNVIKFGNEEFSKIPIFIDKQSGHESDGKIGLKFFEGKYLEINFDENKLFVYDKAPTKLKKYTKLNSRYSQETLYIKAFPFIDKKPVETEFMIHTGFSGALMISDDFAKEYKLLEKFEIILPPFILQNQFAERVSAIEAQKQLAQKSLEQSQKEIQTALQQEINAPLKQASDQFFKAFKQKIMGLTTDIQNSLDAKQQSQQNEQDGLEIILAFKNESQNIQARTQQLKSIVLQKL